MQKKGRPGLILVPGAIALTGCARNSDAPHQLPPDRVVGRTFALTPAVIAMRWQLLNQDVNSFTFRETDQVFESRAVPRGATVWELARAADLKMPVDTFRGQDYSYEQFAGDPSRQDRGRGLPQTFGRKYVPELKGTGYDGVTIRQILQMRSGVDYEERYDFGTNPGFAGKLHEQAIALNNMRFAAGALETKRANTPGSKFNHSTLDAMVLGWMLEGATGEKLETFTASRLRGTLGAEADAFWMADGPPGNGRALNGMGFNATLRDFGRLGLLMLRDGMRDGTRVLPEGWMQAATTMLPTGTLAGRPHAGYGFQIWQMNDEPGAYCAVGLAGQFIYVSPATDTVIVKLSYFPPAEPPNVTPESLAYFKAIAHTPDP
jgi:hypothetical protein